MHICKVGFFLKFDIFKLDMINAIYTTRDMKMFNTYETVKDIKK